MGESDGIRSTKAGWIVMGAAGVAVLVACLWPPWFTNLGTAARGASMARLEWRFLFDPPDRSGGMYRTIEISLSVLLVEILAILALATLVWGVARLRASK
ncbi:MAG: hypothetical protein AAGD14_19405 [Planctomycetota bacterium]